MVTYNSLLPAFENGTDTWFWNVGTAHIDTGEIPKRIVTIFKSRRKLEIYYNTNCPLPVKPILFRLMAYAVQGVWLLGILNIIRHSRNNDSAI
jgi:hypothetical protein